MKTDSFELTDSRIVVIVKPGRQRKKQNGIRIIGMRLLKILWTRRHGHSSISITYDRVDVQKYCK